MIGIRKRKRDLRSPAKARREDEAAAALFKPDWIEETPSLWPRIREAVAASETRGEVKIPERRPAFHSFQRWALASAAAMLLLAGIAGWLVLGRRGRPGAGPADSGALPRVRLLSVELKGKKAKPYIFQTPKASFVWITPSKEIGG
jgi:hypothetical protein